MAGPIKISILANASNAIKGIKQTGDEADKAKKRFAGFGSALGKLAGIGAAIGGAAFFIDAIKGAQDAAKATRILNNQINNLGTEGKLAFKDAAGFADRLGASIGKDDDLIKPVLSKLASFPSAFGKGALGAEAMERATKAAFDLEAIGIGAAESNIVSIGKALDNPIKGMSALAKSGVSFTDEQKKQITNFIKQGDLAGAQKILLAGIETNAKGAAEAATTPMEKVRVAIDNMVEGIATKLLPHIDTFAGFLTNKALPAAEKLGAWLGPKLSAAFKTISDSAREFWANHGEKIKEVLAKIGDVAKEAVSGLKQFWDEGLGKIDPNVLKGIGLGLGVVAIAMLAMSSPITLIVAGVAGLVLGFGYLYKRFELVRQGVALVGQYFKFIGGIWTWLWKSVIKPYTTFIIGIYGKLWEFIKTQWNSVGKPVFKTIGTAVKILWSVFRPVFALIGSWVKFVFSGIVAAWKNILMPVFKMAGQWFNWLWNSVVKPVFAGIKFTISLAWSAIKTVFMIGVNNIKAVFGGIAILRAKASEVFNGIKSVISGAINVVKGVIAQGVSNIKSVWGGISALWSKAQEVRSKVLGAFSGAASWLIQVGKDIVQGIANGISGAWGTVSSAISGLTSRIPAAVKKLLGISSPSKVMMRIGKQITQGLAKGLSADAPVRKAVRDLSSLITTGVSSPALALTTDITGSVAAGTTAGGTSINVTVNVPVSADANGVARAIEQVLRKYESSTGRMVLMPR